MDKELIKELESLVEKFKIFNDNQCSLVERCSCGNKCCGCSLNQEIGNAVLCEMFLDLANFFNDNKKQY